MPSITIENLTEENYKMIEAMASTGFPPEEIAEVLRVEPDDFIAEYKDKESEVYKFYRKGFLESELVLRQRIFKDAGYGSSPAQTLAKKIMDECAYKLKNYE